MKFRFTIVLILIFLILSSQKIPALDITKQITSYVAGRVVDERRFPVPKVKVTINGVEAETDNKGAFRILDIPFPYNVLLAQRSSATAVIYNNVAIDNPELILFGETDVWNTQNASVTVSFPKIPAGGSAVLKFISSDNFYCDDVTVNDGEESKTLTIYWPKSANSISGNIIFLQKSSTAFEPFKEKKITLAPGSVPIKINLKNNTATKVKTSDIIVYVPVKNSTKKGYSVLADFYSYSRNSDFLLAKGDGNNSETNSIIPLKLPLSYRLKVLGFADFKDGSGFVNSIFSQPGASVNVTSETPPEPLTPSDKYLGASGNTEFYYSLGSGTGIYVVEYHSSDPVISFYIVTDQRTAHLSYLSRPEFKNANSIEFQWSVKKYLTYFSVSEFVKPAEFRNEMGYKAVLYSLERTFKTGYY